MKQARIHRSATGSHGMVSAGHPLATLAALNVLQNGGNAFDAAVAASAVACVVLPHACGLGGDAFAVGYTARTKELWALNASGHSPAEARLDRFTNGIPHQGVRSSTVPGIVDGWNTLLQHYGTRKVESLLLPAAEIATEGFIVDEVFAQLLHTHRGTLLKYKFTTATFFPQGKQLKTGDICHQTALGKTLDWLATKGWSDFYRGEVGWKIDRFMQDSGGLIRQCDLHAHDSKWEEPLATEFEQYEIAVTPPNSLGLLLLAQLRVLPKGLLSRSHPNSPPHVDLLLKTKRAVFRKLLPLVGDPLFMTKSPKELLNDCTSAYLESGHSLPSGDHSSGPPDTTCIVVADQEGNVISLIQSIFHYFGSGAMAGDTGILLNNRMVGFTTQEKHVNAVAPCKRPAHTLSPALVLKGSKPYLAIGTPGAYAQTQSLLQVLVGFLIHGKELMEAVESPRWFDDLENNLLIESRMSPVTIAGLQALGYKPRLGLPWDPLVGGVQAILLTGKAGPPTLHGVADPRRQGSVAGW